MARWGTILQWLGLAAIVTGLGACGVSCAFGLASFSEGISGGREDAESAVEIASTAGVASMVMLAAGLASAIVGTILKAAAPKRRRTRRPRTGRP